MTKIITRYFDSAAQAREARKELIQFHRVSYRIVHLFDTSDGVADDLRAAHVDADTAQAYATRMQKNGGAVLLVQAGHKPLGVAGTARDVMARKGAASLDDQVQEVEIEEDRTPGLSILDGHPHILYRGRDPQATTHYMADWPLPLISRRKPFSETVIPRHGRMAAFPIPLLSDRKPYTKSIFARHARMAAFPIPLTIRRAPYDKSIFGRHARMADKILPLTIRRKPFDASLFPRHQRMATVPFPLLIDGKTDNSIIPGQPYMADGPMPLLSDREPYTRNIFGRHARMANIIPLISTRKPYAKSVFPRHARMADMILPLVIRRDQTRRPDAQGGFSLSRMLGLPTVLRR